MTGEPFYTPLNEAPRLMRLNAARIAALEAEIAGLQSEIEAMRRNGHQVNGRAQPPPGLPDQLVTLSQAAAMVHRGKDALRYYRGRGLPPPDVSGKRGQPALWSWKKIRPWLESTFSLRLPESFPGSPV